MTDQEMGLEKSWRIAGPDNEFAVEVRHKSGAGRFTHGSRIQLNFKGSDDETILEVPVIEHLMKALSVALIIAKEFEREADSGLRR